MKLLRHVRCSIPEIERALNYIVDAINERTPRKAPGFLISETSSGWSPRILRHGGGGGGIEGEWPFEVVPTGNREEGTGLPLVRVAIESWLMRSQRCGDTGTITGLGEPFAMAVDQLIWLEVTFDGITGIFSTAEIKHGASWDGYDSPVEWNDPTAENKVQLKARIVIAYTQGVPDPNPYPDRAVMTTEAGDGMQLVQCVTTHLLLCQTCFEGDPVHLMFPYVAAAPSPAP